MIKTNFFLKSSSIVLCCGITDFKLNYIEKYSAISFRNYILKNVTSTQKTNKRHISRQIQL